MTLSAESSSPSALDWKFSQVFGERSPGEEVQDVDTISAIEFEKSGDYLAVGDRGGRVVIFERKARNDIVRDYYNQHDLEQRDFMDTQHPQFQYKTEFQSHEPEFDYLKSLEIEEKINKLKWCATPNGSLFILSTNDKTIKLWKVANIGYGAPARCRKVYAHAHDFNINSISNNSDGETFVSSDDLRINLWNLEVSDQCFNIVDMKPTNMEDLTEVITSAEFHPLHCNLLAYSSSRGFIRLADMRQSALCDHSAKILRDGDSRGSKSFFTEIITSISDIKFGTDGRHILSRDYMNLKLWDTRMETTPVAIYKIHEHLHSKLSDLYNNDAIFDKFGCCVSGDGLHFATGSYSNQLRIFSYGDGSEEGMTIEASKNPSRKPHMQSASRARRSSLSNLTRGFYRQGHENSSPGNSEFSCNLNSKLLHLAWHPKTNLIACGTGNSLFLYNA
ncbi:serine/threonine protein phosphatase 2A 55 kDa regulatory subunit B beta isoform-like isoform X2 [Rhododendron vialii]|uniref:serine/threonine protein phosphatase 2A 55 kDa regulatory subunit B beta isoform-like isoform X2 n=1 Tax=Rhododendron vialii TaxID=182163 RepID=UPI00265F816C|nr:serine/threonine protein phosphatase 2A 55 kDa regulatory subunit B beta isoform-like isoform X2 [Rhododendron vialii]